MIKATLPATDTGERRGRRRRLVPAARIPMDASRIGKTVGPYRIAERIGGGGVGHVYRAVDITLGRTVAVKVLRPEVAARPALVERFRAEAQTVARLNHPNIATVYSLIEAEGDLYMVMEYVEGRTLSALIRAHGRFALEPAFEIFHQALDGIGHAHEVGVVHRDVKGSNLMVDARGRVKVMDFGIARVIGSTRLTRAGNLVGTPEYMSPEQVRGDDATIQSDIYSLGVLLYEMLTGRVPFRREGEFDVLRAHVEQAPPRPSSACEDIPAALEEALLRALAKRPEERFPSTERFREALVGGGAPPRTATTLAPASTGPLVAPEGGDVDPDAPTLIPEADTEQRRRAAPTETDLIGEATARRRRRRLLWSLALTTGLAGLVAAVVLLGGDALRMRAAALVPRVVQAVKRPAPAKQAGGPALPAGTASSRKAPFPSAVTAAATTPPAHPAASAPEKPAPRAARTARTAAPEPATTAAAPAHPPAKTAVRRHRSRPRHTAKRAPQRKPAAPPAAPAVGEPPPMPASGWEIQR